MTTIEYLQDYLSTHDDDTTIVLHIDGRVYDLDFQEVFRKGKVKQIRISPKPIK